MTRLALKLFVLKDERGAIVRDDTGSVMYFHDKMVAKRHRLAGWTVAYGPDHKKVTGSITTKKGN